MTDSRALPPLRHITLSQVSRLTTLPTPRIHTDDDVNKWKSTAGYQDFGLFLRRLNETVVGYEIPENPKPSSQSVGRTIALLDTLNTWVDEIPPLSTPQRFGNLAFRTWGRRFEERIDELCSALLPDDFFIVIPHIKPYLLTSFGSFTRMDYGTGHETSFALFLLCLTLTRFLQPAPEEERDIVFGIYGRYLKLCWRLQDVYQLEPAGSHGVWGLDDYTFLGYIFGSGQLRDQNEIPVSSILHPPLAPNNLYFMCVNRIHQVKQGPFHEHSSQLYSIAVGVRTWAKVNAGLFKMYEAEVLGKRVVVQHIPLGGLLSWADEHHQIGDTSLHGSASRSSSSLHASISHPLKYTSSMVRSPVWLNDLKQPTNIKADDIPSAVPKLQSQDTSLEGDHIDN